MSKNRTASASTLKPDIRYNSLLASKFVNCMMWSGKKATATRIFYDALDQIVPHAGREPYRRVHTGG